MVYAEYFTGSVKGDTLQLDGRNNMFHLITAADRFKNENGYDDFMIVINNFSSFRKIYDTRG